MREVDDENTEARRDSIIAAAARCLAQSGVAKTSISDICREAGVRSGHLYYYFESKDALLSAVMNKGYEEILTAIEHMLDDSDMVSQIVDIHVQAEKRRLSYGLTPAARIELRCYLGKLKNGNRYDEDSDCRLIDAIRRATARAVDNGRLLRTIDVETFTTAVVIIWQGMSYHRMSKDFDIKRMSQAVHLLMGPWSSKATAKS